jgi:serine/threonine-protein kinase
VASSNEIGPQTGEAEFSNTQLYLRPIDGFEATGIEGTIGGSAPFFSPDGKWIGFYNFHEGTLMKVARDGGTPKEITFVSERAFRGGHWTQNGDIYYSDTFGISVIHEDGGESRLIAAPDSEAGEKTYRFPDLLPGSRTLLFTRGSSEIPSYDDADIALLDLDSGEIRVLAQGGTDPQYIPTGHIVFGRAGKAFAIPFDLDRLEVTGSPVEVLDGVVTSDGYGSIQLSCSRNGTLVYVAGGPRQFATQLMFLNSDGSFEDIPQPHRPYGNLALSPGADRIVVSVLGANASLWIYELGRGIMTKLISGWDNFAPIWDRSGSQIAFGSNRNGKNAIWVTASDGTGSPTLLLEKDSNGYPSSWSPDGEWLILSSLSASTGMDIWLLDRTGNKTPAIQTAARELQGRFSPDGRYLAYASDESGQMEIYVQTIPVTGRKWKLSEEGGFLPAWSREGNRIYYWSSQRLMVVPIVLEPEFQPSKARQVLETAVEILDYDIFPGGDRFVVLGRSSTRDKTAPSIAAGRAQGRLFPAQSPDLHVVLNWFGELERVTGGK